MASITHFGLTVSKTPPKGPPASDKKKKEKHLAKQVFSEYAICGSSGGDILKKTLGDVATSALVYGYAKGAEQIVMKGLVNDIFGVRNGMV